MVNNENFGIPKEKLKVFIRNSLYKGNLPFFYSTNFFPELNPIVENWEKIKEELIEYEKINGAINSINTYSPPKLSNNNGWSNLYFENFMWRKHKNRKNFPFTCSILDTIPNCTYGAISILFPNATILPHYGDTNGIVRCHLGLDIPDSHPTCGIRVGTEEQGWENGKFTIFTEAHLHTTWNNSLKKRYILVVDIIPSFFLESKLEICSRVLGAQTFNYFEKRFPILKKIPDSKLGSINWLLAFAWRCFLPIQRRLPFL